MISQQELILAQSTQLANLRIEVDGLRESLQSMYSDVELRINSVLKEAQASALRSFISTPHPACIKEPDEDYQYWLIMANELNKLRLQLHHFMEGTRVQLYILHNGIRDLVQDERPRVDPSLERLVNHYGLPNSNLPDDVSPFISAPIISSPTSGRPTQPNDSLNGHDTPIETPVPIETRVPTETRVPCDIHQMIPLGNSDITPSPAQKVIGHKKVSDVDSEEQCVDWDEPQQSPATKILSKDAFIKVSGQNMILSNIPRPSGQLGGAGELPPDLRRLGDEAPVGVEAEELESPPQELQPQLLQPRASVEHRTPVQSEQLLVPTTMRTVAPSSTSQSATAVIFPTVSPSLKQTFGVQLLVSGTEANSHFEDVNRIVDELGDTAEFDDTAMAPLLPTESAVLIRDEIEEIQEAHKFQADRHHGVCIDDSAMYGRPFCPDYDDAETFIPTAFPIEATCHGSLYPRGPDPGRGEHGAKAERGLVGEPTGAGKEVSGKEVSGKEIPGKEIPDKEIPDKEVPGNAGSAEVSVKEVFVPDKGVSEMEVSGKEVSLSGNPFGKKRPSHAEEPRSPAPTSKKGAASGKVRQRVVGTLFEHRPPVFTAPSSSQLTRRIEPGSLDERPATLAQAFMVSPATATVGRPVTPSVGAYDLVGQSPLTPRGGKRNKYLAGEE
ncbi:hypothetical protein GNI_067110 [Gregarina niphandrodes]|uniref:Uncharacterized protein n=1 Tax=Gregarina niphandrodes TaxID=110365 RepID=A0A023B7S7_GRENI|nr:hypothetical protein GNI_067110 [Gregarina niphandrodes]EZG67648.1 hypothetical protein GNI_067110 [Gregarina niphandrodes]|eukprot:XP_011130177.1 hypothetical protein GNI_067110 [Gregarina niphandrodes]